MRTSLLLTLVVLGVAGCTVETTAPPPNVVVTPAPPPNVTYQQVPPPQTTIVAPPSY
jgi:hypothetical protein